MTGGNRLEAVLLDLDGTLVDSLPVLRRVYERFLAEHGATGSEEEFERWNGPPLSAIVAGLAQAHRIPGDPQTLLEKYIALAERTYLEETPLAEGAIRLLDWLEREKLRVAVVTSTPIRLAEAQLAARGVRARLQAVVGGDQVPRGKPNPDGYAEGLRQLGVPPERAIAVEDTRTGVRAARAAGLRCLGVTPPERWQAMRMVGALEAVGGLDEIREIMAALLDGAGRVVPATRFDVRAAEPVMEAVAEGLDATTADEVDARWDRVAAEKPFLTDGELYIVDGWRAAGDEVRLDGHFTRYRRFIAQLDGLPLGVRPLGVSGATLLEPRGKFPWRLVFGRRSAKVTQYPRCWELVPSGGISREQVFDDGRVDAERHIRRELEEELGVRRQQVKRFVPLGLVEDLDDGVLDLCYRVEIDAEDEALIRWVHEHGEYTELAILHQQQGSWQTTLAHLRVLLDKRGEGVVPTVQPILDLLDRGTVLRS